MASIANPPGAAAPQPASGLALLVMIPALDEERTVGDVIRGIPRDLPGIDRVDVVVVDDGSGDGTGAAAEAAGAVVIRHETSRGVGAAFGTALRYAIERGADLIVSLDADGQFDPADIPALIEPVLAGRADFTSALDDACRERVGHADEHHRQHHHGQDVDAGKSAAADYDPIGIGGHRRGQPGWQQTNVAIGSIVRPGPATAPRGRP